MNYNFESYYLKDKKFNDYAVIILVAKTIALFCDGFSAKLISPKINSKPDHKFGRLPDGLQERVEYVEKLINWCFNNSYYNFHLELFENYLTRDQKTEPKLGYYHSIGGSVLRLEPNEFFTLIKNLKENNLPEDLYYPEFMGGCVEVEPGSFGKFLNSIGFNIQSKRCLTPKELEVEEQKKKSPRQ